MSQHLLEYQPEEEDEEDLIELQMKKKKISMNLKRYNDSDDI